MTVCDGVSPRVSAGGGGGATLHALQSHKVPGGQGPGGRRDREGQAYAERQPSAERGHRLPPHGTMYYCLLLYTTIDYFILLNTTMYYMYTTVYD